MKLTLETASESPPRDLRLASGFELGRRLRELRAAVAQNDQRATVIQSKIAQLNVTIAHYRMHAGAGMRNNEKKVAGMLLMSAAGIESQSAELQRQAAEIRTASTAKRKEMKDINAQLQEHRRQLGVVPRHFTRKGV